MSIDPIAFYASYHGHPPVALRTLVRAVRPRRIVWLVGDSSLDNKHWLLDSAPRRPAPNGLSCVFVPGALVVPDVAYHVNVLLEQQHPEFVCVNAAIEESTLGARDCGRRLLPQDKVVQECLEAGDVIIASLGGNDVALAPTAATVASLAAVLGFASDTAIDAGTAVGIGHLLRLFGDDTRDFLLAIAASRLPALVIPSTIYYPALRGESWANAALSLLGYGSNPARLQRLIRSAFEHATRRIALPGTAVVACPLFEVLDPAAESDYVARVEPSDTGGAKMAQEFVRILDGHVHH